MKLIDFQPEHEQEFYTMCRAFFSSPAVCHEIDDTAMKNTFQAAVEGSPYMRGLTVLKQDAVIGYVLLSFTYSNEVGGMVVWIEELYLKEKFRGLGYGSEILKWIFETYATQVKRFRLEVTDENIRAKKLYQKLGFEELPYQQMVIDQ